MGKQTPLIEKQRAMLRDAKARGKLASLGAFCKLSGPGWMQSATTLGGGSLASSLYLGVLGGFMFLWIQPLAMVFGIIMLAAISYVTLSIGEKPMHALNRSISPVLGYGWAVGSMLACFVFAMPQFSLAVAGVEQNIAADFFADGSIDPTLGRIAITVFFFAVGITMTAFFAYGGKWAKVFDVFIKLSVAAIVLCFFGVTAKLSFSGQIVWAKVLEGFIPNVSAFSKPSADFMVYISQLGESSAAFWSSMIVGQQRDVLVSACAMSVGINMTFLFPYSMLKRKWDKDFRQLAIFDLAMALFIPALLATSCVVIASASQFHAKPAAGLTDAQWVYSESADKLPANAKPVLAYSAGKWSALMQTENANGVLAMVAKEQPAPNLIKPYVDLLDVRLKAMEGAAYAKLPANERVNLYNTLDKNERTMVAMLVKRDASNLADTLTPLVGEKIARYVFGFGVLGMAMNAILMNMLICGLCFQEVIGKFGKPKWQLVGSSFIAISACASLFWEGAKMWLVIHAGVIAMVLLPIAYGAFMVMMNSKKIMGSEVPKGGSRTLWNTLMGASVGVCSFASLWVLWSKLGVWGISIFTAFLVAVVASHFLGKNNKSA